MLGGNLRGTSIPSRRSKNTPSRFILQKLKISAFWLTQFRLGQTLPLPFNKDILVLIIYTLNFIIIITLFIDGKWITVWTLTNQRLSSRSNWIVEVLVFVEGGNPKNPEKNPLSKVRASNKLNPHETASMGIEPGSQRWEASTNPLRQPCSHS